MSNTIKIKGKEIPKNKLIITIVAVILAIIIIPSAIYCIVEGETPGEMLSDIFTSTDDQIIGKWQSDNDVAAYEFYADGTYDCYLSTFGYSGNYTIEGNKLTLTNPAAVGSVVYKVKATQKSLTLTLISERGVEPEDKEVTEYKKVSHISTKSINDLINSLAEENKDKDSDE